MRKNKRDKGNYYLTGHDGNFDELRLNVGLASEEEGMGTHLQNLPCKIGNVG